MSSELQPLGKYKRSWTLWDVARAVGLIVIAWQIVRFVVQDLPDRLASANGPQLVVATVLAIIIGAIVTYMRTGRGIRPSTSRVFLDGTNVLVRGPEGETRIPLSEAVVQHTTTAIGHEEFIDGEHQVFEHSLRIRGGASYYGVRLAVTGMTPRNISKFRDQLNLDLADARWRHRMPDPGVE